jgi:malonate transporter
MSALLDVILPVFLIIGLGWFATWRGWIGAGDIDGLMRFAQGIAAPVLLFKAVSGMQIGAAFQPGMLISFYAGAFSGFAFGFFLARFGFGRPLTDSVAIGFACTFSNSLLLGAPITERAYGADALAGNFAIIGIHAPLIYSFGILMMEWAKAKEGPGMSAAALGRQIVRGIVSQPLVIGLALGFAVNLLSVPVPGVMMAAVDMVAATAIPTALFGLGGVLYRYRPDGDLKLVAGVCFASLILHPMVTYTLGTRVFDLDVAALRSAVVTAAMPLGVNAYIFANMYGVGRRVAATATLVATALAIFTAWGWLHILP